MFGGVLYPNTPSTVAAHDATMTGTSHSAPLQHSGGSGDARDSQIVRAFLMRRVIERRLSGKGTLGASGLGGNGGGVQLDAAEMEIARKLVRALDFCSCSFIVRVLISVLYEELPTLPTCIVC
jgi:hypothetical protein